MYSETVYISGPMTGYIEHNYPTFNRAAAILKEQGFGVLNPAEHFDGDHDRPRSEYLRADIRDILTFASAVCLLPGWETSPGAILEVALAYNIGIHSFLEIDWEEQRGVWVGHQDHVVDKLPEAIVPAMATNSPAPAGEKQPTWWQYKGAPHDPSGTGKTLTTEDYPSIIQVATSRLEEDPLTKAWFSEVQVPEPPREPAEFLTEEGLKPVPSETIFHQVVSDKPLTQAEMAGHAESCPGCLGTVGSPVSLVDENTCVACWHDNHTDQVCGELDDGGGSGVFHPCPCNEQVSEADRGNIVVKPETVLEEAQRIVLGPRQSSYNHPDQDFKTTGRQWGALMENWLLAEHPGVLADGVMPDIAPRIVALMMAALKASREAHKPKRDNRVDGPGYWYCADRIVEGD